MKAIKVDIVTEVVYIPDYQIGPPHIYAKMTPPSIAKIGEMPKMVQQEEYHYYLHKVYNHRKEIEYYLVQHSDKDIFEGLITLSSADIQKFRDNIKDEYFRENKPTEEFLRHYFKETIDLNVEREKARWKKERNYDDTNFVKWVHTKARVDAQMSLQAKFICIGIGIGIVLLLASHIF